jgi:selenocysteine lyase/cysteine desulfurase
MTATPSIHGSELLRLVGANTMVPLVTGGERRYVNFDYAASAPALERVHDAVEELLGWYSSASIAAPGSSRGWRRPPTRALASRSAAS